jgi:hypothetical protein
VSLKVKPSLGVLRATSTAAGRRKTALAAFLTLSCFCATARAEVLTSRYAVSLDGLRVGEAILHTDLATSRYKIGVSADVGLLLVSTQIQGEASGARSGAKLTPEHFQISMSGDDEDLIEFRFANSPEAAADGAVRLRGVFDPLSALLVASLKPSSPSDHLCNTVLPIFTGRERFDLNLRPKPADSAQLEPALILCQATLSEPLVGGTEETKLAWEIGFMKSAKPQFWLVERLVVPTSKGVITIGRTETSISQP